MTDSLEQKVPPRVALIHATALAMEPIAAAFKRHWPQAKCMNLLDDSLSSDHAQKAGVLSPEMTERFVTLAHYAKGTGCQAILFTCSAFGSAIETARAACPGRIQIIQMPIGKFDRRMKPHRVIQTGCHDLALIPGQPVRPQR